MNRTISHIPIESSTDQWPTSSPEAQGIDSAKLVEMIEYYHKQHDKNPAIRLDSITIIRNRHIVADIYFNPLFRKDTKHIIHSCTKSIVSALIGIAIEQGHIASVDTSVLDILNDKGIERPDDRLERLTVKDLLTMQTGLHSEDSYLYQWRGLFKMMATDDWVNYALRVPFDVEPGTRFDYSNISSFLLSALITKATGMDTLTFAKRFLFDPLGIEDVRWANSPKGIYMGWARIWLKPHDMAKFGLLYLQQGAWDGQQVIPAWWVRESTTAHSYPKKYRRILTEDGSLDHKATVGLWLFTNLARPFSDGYGYQFWLDKSGSYAAVGVGGQYIINVPEYDLIVAVTSKLKGATSFFPVKLLKKFILPAVVANRAILANDAAQSKLAQLSDPPEKMDTRMDVATLPPIAEQVSGALYHIETNPWKVDNMQLMFPAAANYAEFSYTAREDEAISYQVGLDNINQLTQSDEDVYAAIGSWTAPNTFTIAYEQIGYSNTGSWALMFAGDEIVVKEVGVTGEYVYRGHKKSQE